MKEKSSKKGRRTILESNGENQWILRYGELLIKLKGSSVEISSQDFAPYHDKDDCHIYNEQPTTTNHEGAVLIGKSPFLHKDLYISRDISLEALTYEEAQVYVHSLKSGGFVDWRLPSKWELDLIYQMKNTGHLKDIFNDVGFYRCHGFIPKLGAWVQNFRNGNRYWAFRTERALVCPVRCDL